MVNQNAIKHQHTDHNTNCQKAKSTGDIPFYIDFISSLLVLTANLSEGRNTAPTGYADKLFVSVLNGLFLFFCFFLHRHDFFTLIGYNRYTTMYKGDFH